MLVWKDKNGAPMAFYERSGSQTFHKYADKSYIELMEGIVRDTNQYYNAVMILTCDKNGKISYTVVKMSDKQILLKGSFDGNENEKPNMLKIELVRSAKEDKVPMSDLPFKTDAYEDYFKLYNLSNSNDKQDNLTYADSKVTAPQINILASYMPYDCTNPSASELSNLLYEPDLYRD